MTQLISKDDRSFIAEKYHALDGSFRPYARFSCKGYLCDETTGLSDDEIKLLLEKLYEDTKGEPHCLVKARAFAVILDHMRIETNSHDYYPCLNYSRPMNQPIVDKWYHQLLDSDEKCNEVIRDYALSGTASIWLDTEHFVPNWDYILENGISGIVEKARNKRAKHEKIAPLHEEQRAFFDSIEIEYSAIQRLLIRLRDYAAAHPNEKSTAVAEAFEHLAAGKPQNTLEALELIYVYFICSEGPEQFQTRSLGNGLDHSLDRFYQADMESGRFTQDEVKTFLAYFMLQFDAIGHPNGHPFYLGGANADGSSRISQLSYDIIDVYESLEIYNPKIQIKVNHDTPKAFLNRVLKMIRSGKSSVVFCCQPGMVKSLMSYGATYEEAMDCDISGCNEMHVKSNEACMISALPNAAKALLYVINNGIDTVTGKKLGLKTGDFAAFKSFEELYEAYLKQLAFIVDNVIEVSLKREKFVGEINPSVLISGTIERSMDQMLDAYAFGVKYPTSALLLCSFATAVDSLMAIKELVFEEKSTTLSEMRDAVNADWNGYEVLQTKALRAKHKYGRNDELADLYASALFKWFGLYVSGKRNSRGGVYKVGIPSTLEYISQGRLTEATPDGRKKGEELSKNTQPVNGMETKGATGYINSALKMPLWLFSEALVLDVMLHPTAVSGEEGIEVLRGIIESYMKRGGISIQFNIFSTEMLIDAQNNPEKYKNLQVRVTGWNVLWNNMSEKEQNAYIKRVKGLSPD